MRSKQNSDAKQQFLDELKIRAKEQKRLSRQFSLPDKLGFLNRWFAKDAIVKFSAISCIISLVIFSVFFRWFYAFEHVVVGK